MSSLWSGKIIFLLWFLNRIFDCIYIYINLPIYTSIISSFFSSKKLSSISNYHISSPQLIKSLLTFESTSTTSEHFHISRPFGNVWLFLSFTLAFLSLSLSLQLLLQPTTPVPSPSVAPSTPTRLPHSSSLSACPSSLIKPWRLSAKRTSPSALDIYEHYELDDEGGNMKDTDMVEGRGWKRRCTVCQASIIAISCRF